MSLSRAMDLLLQSESLANLRMQRERHFPSPTHAEQILKLSLQLKEEVTLAQAEISKLEAGIDALRAACAQMVTQIAVNRSVPAPVHRLPPELLADIFLYLPSSDNMRNELCRLEYGIARVCTTWRAVALGLPRLWTCIDLQSINIDAELYLRQYLHRSQNHPLHIACDTGKQPGLLPLLSAHAALRWKTLTLRISSKSPLPDAMPTVVDTPLLQRLRMNINGVGYDLEAPDLLAFLRRPPQLRELVVRGGSLVKTVVALPQAPSLECLHIFIIGPHRYTLLLASIQQYSATLTTLRLGIARIAPIDVLEEATRGEIVTLPALKYMRLYYEGHNLLRFISAPNLHTMSVDVDGLISSTVFLGFVERGGRRSDIRVLEVISVYPHLYVDKGGRETAALLCCLARLEGLEHLRFVLYAAMDKVLEGLVWKDDAPQMLPNLQGLTIPGRLSGSSALADLCRSRRMTTVSRGREVIAMAEGRRLKTLVHDLIL
ncbi:hypothetical protein BD626DRAFT_245584 [Schizophyllum amplum]|uniref:F-box domain-containing protein n=1 Tax=Schizophyllum amplum TaxID=97359 RepID=A0A550BVN8_9AGAR|nr:hypothetical protein BD626DRAFT_245584 [Auriculariopsis ampla]